jgi:hypothetical protein
VWVRSPNGERRLERRVASLHATRNEGKAVTEENLGFPLFQGGEARSPNGERRLERRVA